jgi:hypothetical protein
MNQASACPGDTPLGDHHSAYLARAVAGLTVQGRGRVDELLDQLVASAGGRTAVVQFAETRRAEAGSGRVEPTDPGLPLAKGELEVLTVGFMAIRDGEQLDDVADWANAVLALLKDERASD